MIHSWWCNVLLWCQSSPGACVGVACWTCTHCSMYHMCTQPHQALGWVRLLTPAIIHTHTHTSMKWISVQGCKLVTFRRNPPFLTQIGHPRELCGSAKKILLGGGGGSSAHPFNSLHECFDLHKILTRYVQLYRCCIYNVQCVAGRMYMYI